MSPPPPSGMVLVRTETGQLVMVPQQVLAQAQAKTQQAQTVTNIAQRPATPTAGATIRVSTATTVGLVPTAWLIIILWVLTWTLI